MKKATFCIVAACAATVLLPPAGSQIVQTKIPGDPVTIDSGQVAGRVRTVQVVDGVVEQSGLFLHVLQCPEQLAVDERGLGGRFSISRGVGWLVGGRRGVRTRIKTGDKIIALTMHLDASTRPLKHEVEGGELLEVRDSD